MQRKALALLIVSSSLVLLPHTVHAGGVEFPGGGTRSLGRGGAGFARADDPSLMVRNPALLADLVDDQAMLGAHLVLAHSCFQPTGAYGWTTSGQPDVSDFGKGPIVLNVPANATDLNRQALQNYAGEPLPKVCYQGDAPILPHVGLSMKLNDDLGVGLGFFPPDTGAMNQWGNPDGTVDTPQGLRPNPLRFASPTGSMLSTSFFTALAAVGYRVADWLRIGGGFQWNAVVFQTRTWTARDPGQLDPHSNIRADTLGRDLFVPGLIASIDLKPIDNLDIALGFRWSDRVQGNAKLDVTPGQFGTGKVYDYLDPSGQSQHLGTSVPQTTNNIRATVSAPPIWVPQLSVGVRYADRLEPRAKNLSKARAAAGRVVEDHMRTERWDVELDGVYYLNSAYNSTRATITGGTLTIPELSPDGTVTQSKPFDVGHCAIALDPMTKLCPDKTRLVVQPHGGQNQMSVRLGGDYNVLPGLLALRAGLSYETDGRQVQFLEVMNYMQQRVGLHVGFTLRVAAKTDISFGFAHFIAQHVRLQVNDTQTAYPARYKKPEYNFDAGLGVKDSMGEVVTAKNGFDGVAQQPIANGSTARTIAEPGPDYVNAGSYYVNLDVVSVGLTQHF
jgi:long-subunit fatty acid transport protein